MGLDICVYQNLTPMDPEEYNLDSGGLPISRKDGEPLGDFILPFSAPCFDARCLDLEHSLYFYDGCAHERIGGYGYYGRWRFVLSEFSEWLMETAPTLRAPPFFELINFSDCEGFLGTEVCRRLASHFEKYDEKVDEFFAQLDEKSREYEDTFGGIWETMGRLFEMAKERGAIQFC